MDEKNIKMPEFYMILVPKNYQNTLIFIIFARKFTKFPNFTRFLPENARILRNNYPENIFPDFFSLGGGGARAQLSPRLLSLYMVDV